MNARSRRPLSLTNLRAFEAVARPLSFGAAAEELHVTQSAVSRQIKGLEDELGAPLFVRGTRHVRSRRDGQRCCARSSRCSPSSTRACSRSAARAAGSGSASRPSRRSARSGCCRGSRRSSASTPTSTSASRRTTRSPTSTTRTRPRAALLQPGAGAAGARAPVRRDADAGGQPGCSEQHPERQGAAAGPARPTWRSTRCSRKTTTAPSSEFLSWRHWLAATASPR